MKTIRCYDANGELGGMEMFLKVKEIEAVGVKSWYGRESDSYDVKYYFVYRSRSGGYYTSNYKSVEREPNTKAMTISELKTWLGGQLMMEATELLGGE